MAKSGRVDPNSDPTCKKKKGAVQTVKTRILVSASKTADSDRIGSGSAPLIVIAVVEKIYDFLAAKYFSIKEDYLNSSSFLISM